MSGFENTETAASYDYWCAVWLLSNVIGRRITVARPFAPVYLNVYAILCAEAGITRKSSAVRAATTLLREYVETDPDNIHMSVMSGSITAEKLDAGLAQQTALWGNSHVALSSSELVSLLGRDRAAAYLPGKLTDLYDCPAIHTRSSIARGEVTARDVYLTLLGASTPSWLVRAINPDVVEGGFTSRCLFILEDKPKRLVAWPEEDVDVRRTLGLIQSMRKIADDARYVAVRAGGIRLTAVAKRNFTRWYEGRTLQSDAYGASFQAREDHHILRLAGILSASDGSWEIDDHHIEYATQAVLDTKSRGMALFGSGIAASKTYALVDRIRGTLVQAGRSGLSQSALSASVRKHGTLEEQRTILTIMHEMNLIQKFQLEHDGPGKPTTMWRATKSMMNNRIIEEVVDLIVPQEV